MILSALVLAFTLPLGAHADDLYAGLDQGCISVLRASHYSDQQARALCFQYSMEEKRCVIDTYRRVRDFRRVQEICLQVDGDGRSPYPWAPGYDYDAYCDTFPSDPYCQDPGFRLGWSWPLGR
jgi:hypothetical protein